MLPAIVKQEVQILRAQEAPAPSPQKGIYQNMLRTESPQKTMKAKKSSTSYGTKPSNTPKTTVLPIQQNFF